MKTHFSTSEAIVYCKNNNINMLLSDINWTLEDAIFKLFITSEDLLVYYLDDTSESVVNNYISPEDLALRELYTVWLDLSEIREVNGKFIDFQNEL